MALITCAVSARRLATLIKSGETKSSQEVVNGVNLADSPSSSEVQNGHIPT
ncbi:MAG: hypothetical protein ACE5J9_11700 [Methanosarcinales archaeon]